MVLASTYLADYCTSTSLVPGRSALRSAAHSDIVVPSYRTDWDLRSFAVAGHSSWNVLLVGLRSSSYSLVYILYMFAKNFKTHLFGLAYTWQGTHFWVCIAFCKVQHSDSVTKPDYYYYYHNYYYYLFLTVPHFINRWNYQNFQKYLYILSFTKNTLIHDYDTRQKNNLHLPKCRTSLRQQTAIFQGPKFWNMLPSEIRSSPSLGVFKCKLRNLLLFT